MSDYEYFYQDSSKTIEELRNQTKTWRYLAVSAVGPCRRPRGEIDCPHCAAVRQIKELTGDGE